MAGPPTKHFSLPRKPESRDGEKARKHSRAKSASRPSRKHHVSWVYARTQRGLDMADKRGLGLLGFLFGGITAAVALTAFMVVQTHISHLRFGDASLASQVTVGYR